MAIVGRLNEEGLQLAGEINDRLPSIINGLVAHYPFDGRGGAFDSVGGNQTIQNVETGVNLLEAMKLDWRDPSSWYKNPNNTGKVEWDTTKQALKFTGNFEGFLTTPIVIDYNKHYTMKFTFMQESQSSTGLLYLGGYSALPNGSSNNGGAWDYLVASGLKPTLGSWTTMTGTKNGTAVAATGWGGSQGVATKYFFGGLFNYNCQNITDVVYIKDISVIITDADTSNTTISSEGVEVNEATTNLYTTPLTIYNNYGVPATLVDYPETFLGQKVQRLTMTPGSAQVASFQSEHYGHGVYGNQMTFKASTKYAISIYWRPVSHPDTQVSLTAANSGVTYDYYTEDLGNGWKRSVAYKDGTIATANTDYVFFSFWCPSFTLGQNCVVDWACPQIEEGRTFATEYALGTRAAGTLSVPFSASAAGSIVFNVVKKGYSNVGSNTNGAFVSCAGTGFYIYTGNATTLQYWGKDSTLAEASRISVINAINVGQKYQIIFTWNGKNCSLYKDGVLQGTYNDFNVTPLVGQNLYIGSESVNGRLGNVRISNLSIYNKDLSLDEIQKLYKGSFNIGTTGNATMKIVEKPISIPTNAVYYPLSLNSKDNNKIFAASDDVNTIYTNKGVWVGAATTNEFVLPTFETVNADGGWTHWGSTGIIGTFGQNTDRNFIYSPTNNYSHWVACDITSPVPYLVYQSPAFAGGYRSVQAIICMSDGSPVTNAKIFPSWNASTASSTPVNTWTSIERIGESKWYLCKCEGINQDGTNDLVGFYIRPGYKAYIDSCQLEQKAYCTPFVNGTRAESSLEFNLCTSLGLNWNLDWSIIYWKKPVGTSLLDKTGYNLDSFGCNSNSVGGGYLWWGKAQGSDTLNSSTPLNITPVKYFNHWRMISLIKTGTTLTIKEWSPLEGISTRTVSIGTIASNYFVNQYGYDLKLGGYDNAYGMNSWYRDLIVVKGSAISDQQLSDMFRKEMSQQGTTLRVQGNLKEKVTLV